MIRIGKIAATHGLAGNVILTHITGATGWLSSGDALFVALRRDSRIPFFVNTVKWNGKEEALVSFDDVQDVESAKKLVGREVFADEGLIATVATDTPLLWIGFNLVDKTKGSIGPIEDVYQAGAQWLAQLTVDGKEVLIPLVDAFLMEVNTRNRFIRMNLPEGLLEV